MATVITPPNPVTSSGFKIFLAGAIDMGEAVDWQSDAIQQLRNEHGLILLNPRRDDFTTEKLDEQIMWELDALERSDLIVMWFPSNSKAPISLLEAGLYMRSGKLILGIEKNFYRTRNLQLTAMYYKVPIYSTLHELISAAVNQYKTVTTQDDQY